MKGDSMEVHVAPNTLIGALTQDAQLPDNFLYVSQSVLDNIKIGYYIGLYNQYNEYEEELGQVIEIDKNNSKIILDTTIKRYIPAGNYLAMCIKIIPKVYFYTNNVIEIGKNIPTSQFIPANTDILIKYINNNNLSKTLSIFTEYLPSKKAMPRFRSMPMTSPVDFISGPILNP